MDNKEKNSFYWPLSYNKTNKMNAYTCSIWKLRTKLFNLRSAFMTKRMTFFSSISLSGLHKNSHFKLSNLFTLKNSRSKKGNYFGFAIVIVFSIVFRFGMKAFWVKNHFCGGKNTVENWIKDNENLLIAWESDYVFMVHFYYKIQ